MSEPSLEGEELRKRGKRGVKNDNGQGKHVAQDEGDFVDESELKGALQIGVLKIADSTSLDVGARNGMDLKVEEDVINRVSALIWDTVADHWSEDLAMFSAHANRQKVQLDDVRLLTRRNPDLFQASCNLAGVSLPENNGLHKKSQNVGRKRKKNDREELLSTPTPQSESKKSKNFTTSTPKINTNSLISQFPQEITPIRPFSANEIIIDDDVNYQRLTTIQEKSDEIEEKQEDSFELDYDTTVLGTSIAPKNMTSLIRQAENYQDEDHQRLEALVPECGEEEEFDFTSVNSMGTSFDRQKNENSNIDKHFVENQKSDSVFSKKVSAFEFDGLIDSAPIDSEIPARLNEKKNTSKSFVNSEKSVKLQKNKSSLSAGADSFDEFDFDV